MLIFFLQCFIISILSLLEIITVVVLTDKIDNILKLESLIMKLIVGIFVVCGVTSGIMTGLQYIVGL